uniref:Retrovirus-related Pol polyprotein from transposon TNT 1-94 n=1 Tax=Tanacetum cinerariifolium TaxID=118510 RepID=A0A6L2K4B0_TANCI|nr:retrovirus-related Pol polyprotein from transposon TNT 1-94 [Tanacetum cinerariifolium]
MANLLEDIQCAGSDTRPPMLDRTNFASWQQRIRLYCQGKENGVNILKLIDEGPFQMGTVREPLAEGTEGAPYRGPERPRVYSDLSPEENDQYNANIWATKILLQGFMTAVKLNRGLRDSNYDQLYAYLKQHGTHAKENKMMLDRFSQHTVDPLALMSNVSHQQHYSPSSSTSSSIYVPPQLADNAHLDSSLSPKDNLIENLTNTLALLTQSYKTFLPQTNNQLRTSSNTRNQATVQGCIARNCTQPNHPQNSEYYKDKMMLMQAQENGIALDAKQLLFLAGGHDNTIDDDVDEQPIQDLALNVDNVFQADECDAFDSDVDEAPMAQTMFMANLSSADPVTDEARPSYDSNILFEVQDHDHYQDVVCAHHEEHAMHDNVQLNHAVDSHADYTSDSNMITYDQYVKDNAVPVEHKREQKINEQLRLIISNRNFKEETLKKELHSIKLQLASTINHNKSMVEKVTFLKKDFKQKENKYLEDFLDIKSLKEKVEDRLFKQDQSLQRVHMLCRPNLYYNELNKVAIGYKNPLCLTYEKQVQPDLYNGHEIIKDNHVLAIVHNTKDTLKIAEITRRKMNNKMKDPECVTHKSHHDNHEELVNRFSKLEVNHLNLQLKYQNLKDSFGNNPPTPDKDTPDFDSVFVIGKIQASLHGKDNVIRKLKKQLSHLQETRSDTVRTLKITHAKHIEQVTALTIKNVNLKAQILDKVNSVSKDHVIPKVLAPGKHAIDVEPIVPRLRNNKEAHLDYLRHLKESVETIRDIVEEAKVVRKKQVTFAKPFDTSNSNTHKRVAKVDTQKTNVTVPPSTGVNCCTNASGSQPRSNTKKNRILPAKGVNKLQVEEQSRTNKSLLRTSTRVDSSSCLKRTVINSNSDSVCQTCNKCLISLNHDMCVVDYLQSIVAPLSIHHNCNVVRKVKQVWKPKQVRQVWKPTGKVLTTIGHQWRPTGQIFTLGEKCPLTRLLKTYDEGSLTAYEFHKKFIRTVRFGNDHFGAIMGYGDYMIGDSQIQVGLNKTVRYICTDNGTEFVNHTLTGYYEHIGIFHQKTVPRTPQQNSVVERRKRTLVEAARTMLIFSKAMMFLWAEAMATTCYTQNRSLIHTRHNKTPYELVHNMKPDLTFFRVFGALCYPTNDSEDLGELQPTADIGIFVGYAPSRKGYRIYNKRTRRIIEIIHVQFDELTEPMAFVHLSTGPAPNFLTLGQISLGLVPNPVPVTPYVPPTKKDLEILFQPMFDEYLEPPRVERPVSPVQAVQAPVN